MAVRKLVRGVVVAAVTAGAVVPVTMLSAPSALADPCPNGTARVFLGNETNTCQGAGSVSYTEAPVSKVCSMTSTDVAVDIQTNIKKRPTRHVEISNGQCSSFDMKTQIGNTVTVTPN
ncbi:hypothetical protein [Nocardia asteroides]|jgi:hypothetical protein|nr:hypothetical protein [Nocardia asteroides]TLF70525.1 hypothetical protein FEK33_10185 [Nocardia asteroides NBRC 15531]UGT50082.1 hypothetical protein LT345_05695 [Nocardia asteroides]SFN21479.1 hypothetical protein SAMN05444423_10773 [Nocardia asteroides]VEG37154.1 Uncharacterised protein [Nocardia asteroides]